ncbi:hypothetical protein Ocin01_09364 [Orchesella cincta]|uniref:Uncharacterized protein n=1 Tax=Orchesella cincta TaxID=48709 RepID=A0A1D2MW76_ORCCI|nr:hypothetical protein Ocin01_09364 [Orchesella cincta]
MSSTISDSTVPLQSAARDCDKPNRPQHGLLRTAGSTQSSSSRSRDYGKKNCPKHVDRVLQVNAEGLAKFAEGLKRARQNTNNVKLGVSGATYGKQASTNPLKFNGKKDIGKPAAVPNACQSKLTASPRVTFNKTKMQQEPHAEMFKLIARQQQEIEDWKKKYEDETRYRDKERKLRDSLRVDLEGQMKTNVELQGKLAKAEILISQLQKKLQLTEITTQKLSRRSSETFHAASKCRALMLSVQDAQNTSEVKMEAEKWSAVFSNIVRQQHNEIHDLQRQLGLSRAESDISEAQSESLNTLDTSMFDLEPKTPT